MAHRLARMLDDLSCRIAGHIWLQQIDTEPDGVKLCTRCGARDDSGVESAARSWRRPIPPPDIVPEHRPWLEPPYEPPLA